MSKVLSFAYDDRNGLRLFQDIASFNQKLINVRKKYDNSLMEQAEEIRRKWQNELNIIKMRLESSENVCSRAEKAKKN